MIPKTLSIVERQILANQFRILENIEDDKDYYRTKAEILENGYSKRYAEIFVVDVNETPFEICDETDQILNMYRRINNAIGNLSEDEKRAMDLKKIRFEGFDANNDPHYHYMSYCVEDLDLWKEHRGNYLNSHSSLTIDKYRSMLTYQSKALENKMDLDKEDLQELIEVA